MSQQDLITLAVMASVSLFYIGYVLGEWRERSYWIKLADNGYVVHHRGKFYRVTKNTSYRLGEPLTTGEPATTHEPKKPTR